MSEAPQVENQADLVARYQSLPVRRHGCQFPWHARQVFSIVYMLTSPLPPLLFHVFQIDFWQRSLTVPDGQRMENASWSGISVFLFVWILGWWSAVFICGIVLMKSDPRYSHTRIGSIAADSQKYSRDIPKSVHLTTCQNNCAKMKKTCSRGRVYPDEYELTGSPASDKIPLNGSENVSPTTPSHENQQEVLIHQEQASLHIEEGWAYCYICKIQV